MTSEQIFWTIVIVCGIFNYIVTTSLTYIDARKRYGNNVEGDIIVIMIIASSLAALFSIILTPIIILTHIGIWLGKKGVTIDENS